MKVQRLEASKGKLLESRLEIQRQNTHYVEMSLFDTSFYEDYIDFKNYIRDVLHARYTNVATENELVSDEKESYSRAIKLVTLEEKKGNSTEEK